MKRAGRWIEHPGRALTVATVVLGFELACTALAVRGEIAWALGLHGAASLVLAAMTARPGPEPTVFSATMQLTAMMLPFLGPVAATGAIAVLLFTALRHDPVANAALWHEHLFPNLAGDALGEQMEAIARQHTDADTASEIESFYDVLRWGSLSQQEHVLSMISRSFKPEFAPVLRAGLAVDDLGLRAQAAAGLSLLEARLSGRLVELQKEFARTGDAQSALVLTQALSDAAHSGLYDDDRSAEMRAEIVSILTPLAEDGNPRVVAMLGRTLIHLGAFERAAETLAPAVEAGTRDDAAFSWLLEALFRQGDYARLRTLLTARAAEVSRLVQQDGPLAPALRFWAASA